MCHGIPVGSFKLNPRIRIGNSVNTMHLNFIKHPKVKCFPQMWFEELDWTGSGGGQPHKQKVGRRSPRTTRDNCGEVGTKEKRVKAWLCQNIHSWFQRALKVDTCKISQLRYKMGTENYSFVSYWWQQIHTLVLNRDLEKTKSIPLVNHPWLHHPFSVSLEHLSSPMLVVLLWTMPAYV